MKSGQKKAVPKSIKGARFGKKSRDWRHKNAEERKTSRLQSNCIFDDRFRLVKNSQNEKLLNDIFEKYVKDHLKKNFRKKDTKLKDLSAFLANLVVARGKYLSIPKDESNYDDDKNRYVMVSLFTIELLNIFKKTGLIEEIRGYKDFNNPEKSFRTRIKKSRPLTEMLWEVNGIEKRKSKELIELKTRKQFKKNDKSKRILGDNRKYIKIKAKPIHYHEIDYPQDVRKQIWNLRTNLVQINKVNDNADIRLYIGTSEMAERLKNAYQDYGNVEIGRFKRGRSLPVNTQVKAGFTENFDENGRLYTEGIFRHQEFSEEDRKWIRIDGKPTVELDYSGLHPRLLYALEGIQYNEDPYKLPAFTKEENQVLRPFFKYLVMVMLNSEKPQKTKFGKAVGSCNCWLDPTLYQPDGKFTDENYDDLSDSDKRYFNDLKKIWELGIKKAHVKDILNEFCAHHDKISKYFCTGSTGGSFQNSVSRFGPQNLPQRQRK